MNSQSIKHYDGHTIKEIVQLIATGAAITALLMIIFLGVRYNHLKPADHSKVNELKIYVSDVQAMPSTKESRAFLLLADNALIDNNLTKKEFEELDESYWEIVKNFAFEQVKGIIK